MKKPLLFVALVLGLLISACSQTPLEQVKGGLEPQFGTAHEDSVAGLAVSRTGAVFSLYNYVTPGGWYDWDDDCCWYYDHEEVAVLTRYDAAGKLLWQQNVLSHRCDYDYCSTYKAEAVFVDENDYTYVLVSDYYGNEPDGSGPELRYYLQKYAPLGELVATIDIDWFSAYRDYVTLKLTVDLKGNIYVAAQTLHSGSSSYLAKYNNVGRLVWNRSSSTPLAYGTPTDLTVSSAGNIYVVGTKGLARFNSTGNLVWSKTGTFDQVILSGSNIYTRYRKDIRKYDGNGKQLWLKSQSGLNGMVVADIFGDGSGNIYVAGKFSKTSSNRDAFVRKLSTSGSVLWTQQYGTSAYDDALGIATVTGSEIYVTGSTLGSLSHVNYGGLDGYLRKMNSSGSRVWTR